MIKNKHLSKVIVEQIFYVFISQIKHKCKWNRICVGRAIL